jgi:hypothetical protein
MVKQFLKSASVCVYGVSGDVSEETVANWAAKLTSIVDGHEAKDVGFEATIFIKDWTTIN